MLFRRFALYTVLIAGSGILFGHMVESHQRQSSGINLEERLKAWEEFDRKRACKLQPEICVAKTVSATGQA
ncbi:MAG: hypothetical protein AAGF28_04055 [Pseudomonadota bacterium]